MAAGRGGGTSGTAETSWDLVDSPDWGEGDLQTTETFKIEWVQSVTVCRLIVKSAGCQSHRSVP